MKERDCEERKQTRISGKEVEHRLGQGLGEADVARGQGLSAMARIKRAKLVQVRRERGRAEAKHGAKSARVERLDRQLVAEHRILVDARAERDRNCKPAPERESRSFTVYGYARDADGHALGDYQVELVARGDSVPWDSKNGDSADWDSARRDSGDATIAATKTNDAGYYVLVARAAGPYQRELNVEGEVSGKDKPGTNVYAGASFPGTLLVKSPAGKLVHRECRRVEVRAGGLVYRDLRAKLVTRGGTANHPSRYLGNAKSRELHDVKNEKAQCQLAEIHPAHRVHFTELATPRTAGYDPCAYCFGKDQSRR